MIKFEKIRFKNFLSFGNVFTEITLNGNSNTLIVGKNGSGKSTLLDALTFSLFGKAYRPINKPQLVNSVNEKECVVETQFVIGTVEWRVCRGIKPTFFHIYRNGTLLEQDASSIDQQKWFEQNVLKMNYKSFSQIVILGTSNYIPFMQLPLASRREVIEELLDVKIFSSMNVVIKDKIKKIKDELNILTVLKKSVSDKVDMQKEFIYEIEKQNSENIEQKNEKIKTLLEQQQNLEKNNILFQSQVEKLNEEIKQVANSTNTLKKYGTLKGKLSQKISTIKKELNFFHDNTTCPTCTQHINEDFRESKLKDLNENTQKLSSAYRELENTIKSEEKKEKKFSELSTNIINLNHKISKNNTSIVQLITQVKDIEAEISSIKSQTINASIEQTKLQTYEEELEEVKNKLIEHKKNIEYHEYLYELLKDSGVKSKIIKKYLPLINYQINRYLQMMDFYINFSFDSEFNETVNSAVYDNFSYGSFSEGQKQRINLSLLFAWREIAKIKNSTNTNLLILDEVFDSSMDSNGTDDFLKIIKYTVNDSNIFVISHKEGLSEKFDNVMEFEKKGNFSDMKVKKKTLA